MGWTPGPGPTAGDDTFVGVYGVPEIAFGFDGNDTLSGNYDDELDGGAGADRLSGGATMRGGDGDDVVTLQIDGTTASTGAPLART